jgi:hypothetical protein
MSEIATLDEPQNALLLAALLQGSSVRAAAKAAGMSEATAHRRLRDPEFASELVAASRQVAVSAYARVVGLADQAAQAYEEVLAGDNALAKVKAARDVFDAIARLAPIIESAVADERLRDIERSLGIGGGK